jgi:hypothetical protein
VPAVRRFYLERTEDISGVSGTGHVAEGVELSDGRCILRWKLPISSIGIYESMPELVAVHGHAGATVARYVDAEPSTFLLHPGRLLDPDATTSPPDWSKRFGVPSNWRVMAVGAAGAVGWILAIVQGTT